MSIKFIADRAVFNNTDAKSVIKIKGNTVGECLEDLIRQKPFMKKLIFDDKGKLRQECLFYINENYSYSNDLTKQVIDGDEIRIRYFRGGC
jgi:hypothetical protein